MNVNVGVVINRIRQAAKNVRQSKENRQAARFLKENKVSLAEQIAEEMLEFGNARTFILGDYQSAKTELNRHQEKVSSEELEAVNNLIRQMALNIEWGGNPLNHREECAQAAS